jgi:cell division septum initiation protein DivIVA
MSTADLELFGPPDAESVYPRFTTVLRGYDPDQVHEYIMALVARTESLENELDEAREQRDSARRRYQMARDDAYNQLGARMADFIKLADQQADRIRREADDEAKQQVSEARDLAQQIRREAEEQDERLRLQAEEVLQHAVAERDRLLGGLSLSRELALAELSTARDHLSGIVAQLESAMEVARSAHIGEPAEATAEGPGESPAEDPRAEDLLERTEGFDIIMPEFLLREEGGDQEG